jgi:Ser/Thr protein kinase RdoA (MazF antagonist)
VGGKISGVIDFGDSVRSWRVNDVAIALAYLFVMLHRTKPAMKTSGFESKSGGDLAIEAVSYFMQGVSRVYELTSLEMFLIPVLAACRLSISGTMGSYSYSLDPTNEYLKEHAEPAWNALRTIRERVKDVREALKDGKRGDNGNNDDEKNESPTLNLLSPGEYYSN